MIRSSSRNAYQDLKESGKLITQEEHILWIVQNYPNGMTLREISKHSGYDINAVSGRVNTLKKDGKLIELPKRKCSITGKTVIPLAVKPLVAEQLDLI